MRLTELLRDEPMTAVVHGGPGGRAADPDIAGLTADSRVVEPGFLFAALPGTRTDGRTFVPQALERGAVALLLPEDGVAAPPHPETVAVVTDPLPRRRFARMAARFYGRQPEVVCAVTGTNGKTSTAVFARQIWETLGRRAASLGTLGLSGTGLDRPGRLTTPDPVQLHALLAEAADAGCVRLCLEASSHGLAQYRLDGVQVRAAAFTNLSRDHLDYHGTEGAYLAAKTRLFTEVLMTEGTAVLNADAPQFPTLRQAALNAGRRVLAYGRNAPESDIRLHNRAPHHAGQRLTLSVGGRPAVVDLPLVGGFQAMNALAALGLVLATGESGESAIKALEGLCGVPGRLEPVGMHRHGGAVYVDYAHTPDALQTVLAALRPHTRNRLIVVFGCGGDRDRGKRPEMGAIAAREADVVVVTDDNPRTEDPAAIRREILTGCPNAVEISDRGDAIRHAVALLAPGDVLLIAGKGHESGQIVGETILPFDDRLEARAALNTVDDAATGGEAAR